MWWLLLLLAATTAAENVVVYTIRIPKDSVISPLKDFDLLVNALDLLDIKNRDKARERLTGSLLCVKGNTPIVELQFHTTASNPIFSLSTAKGCVELYQTTRRQLSTEDEALVYAALGSLATLTVVLMLFLCYRYFCCCCNKTKPVTKPTPQRQQQQSDPDLEMTPLTTTTQPERPPPPPPPPVTPLPVSMLTREQEWDLIASHFESNCKIPAASFEKHWATGQVVDVWGCTLKHDPPLGDALNTPMLHLRLLLIASGCVQGVEKMYWAGMKKDSGGGTLGMIEISTDLQSKRLSAVFKLSRTSNDVDQTCFRNLFDAFKQLVSEHQ